MDSASARSKLKASGKPYWRSIGPAVHLGYRKNKTGGKWLLRRYLGSEKYVVETVAAADDHSKANGDTILHFFQAQRKAREIAVQKATPQGPLTFSAVLDAYFQRLVTAHSTS